MMNPQTHDDNKFQVNDSFSTHGMLATQAYVQVSQVAEKSRSNGINVHLFDDKTEQAPDSVFPNNWFSTHSGGHVAIYPMFAPNRRKERQQDKIETLKSQYRAQDIVDYSGDDRTVFPSHKNQ